MSIKGKNLRINKQKNNYKQIKKLKTILTRFIPLFKGNEKVESI